MTNKFKVLLIICIISLIHCSEDSVSSNQNSFAGKYEKEVYALINSHRTGMGLAALEWSEIIALECRKHSQDMAGSRTLSHNGFNDRINRIGEKISWSWAGENVAYNYSAQSAVTAWLNSTGHKSNIESNSNLTGVGVAFDEDSVMYFTQIFIRSSN